MECSFSCAFSRRAKSLFTIAALSVALPASAGVVFDLTGTQGQTGSVGNTISFSSGGINVDISAYGETGHSQPSGSGFFVFEEAHIASYSTGLGVCNQEEIGATGSISACINNGVLHQVDNVSRDDLVVLQFDQVVNFINLTVDPFQTHDRDISYWVGNSASLPDLLVETFDTLNDLTGFGNPLFESASASSAPFTHSLSGTGNILLISADYLKDQDDRFKIADIKVEAAVPLPAGAWLFLSALGGLVGLRYKRR